MTDGTVFTGAPGETITIVDNYYCPGGVCPGGEFTIQTAAHGGGGATVLSSDYTMTDGTVFTGAKGATITVTDGYYTPGGNVTNGFDIQ
eukprot:CAMPEP_0172172016 /NCGR_PEP_ID=MMETSP1050-20130122/12211_1 /TAXON_ID=233186 /ORGANISM="Cryptomonas curvata, Strain CCAP979/52" /LENGTH=88 /DNA_ID=CAMNT_0012843507 /DNA_START=427 /DNA_END=690 /DNA_ORIENTATION=+